ncbi:MAG: PorP/SprF family type IX secretion system membrane protein [Saprospiraceae bacterium]|nr:PorP/SprF family type IX secretion system membrane protein [Saprospiraceae bacterium]
MIRCMLFLLFPLFLSDVLLSQDIHFSQYYNTPLVVNPANTGIFNGDKRLTAGYRSQWSNVVPWETFYASYDQRFVGKFHPDTASFFSAGLMIYYDRSSAIADLALASFNVTGSYTLVLDNSNLITFGALLGPSTRGFDRSSLLWDNQWNESTFFFDSDIDSREAFDSDQVTYFETGLGINYRWQKSYRNHIDVGAALYHVLRPGVSYFNVANTRLERRITLTAVGQIETSELFDFQGFAMAEFQGPYREVVVGGLKKFYLAQTTENHVEIHLGIGHRFEVAWFPILAIQYNSFYGAVSYDIDATNVEKWKKIAPRTLELHITYIIANPKWLSRCPVY